MYFEANTVKYAVLTSSSTNSGTQLPTTNLISKNKNKNKTSFKLLVELFSGVGYLGCGDDALSCTKRHNGGDEDKHFANKFTIPNPDADTTDSSMNSKIGDIHVGKVIHIHIALLSKVSFVIDKCL